MAERDRSSTGATRSGWKLRIRWATGAVAAAGLALLLPGAGAASPLKTLRATHHLGLIKTSPARVSTAQSAAVRAEAVSLPASVDLTPYAMPVGNQGQVGSCAAWAADYTALGYWENKLGLSGIALEPMYTYAQVTGGVDRGSTIESNLYIDQTQGVEDQADYWQGNFDYRDQPTAPEKAHAVNWKLSGYANLTIQPTSSSTLTQQSIKTALAAGTPVVIGIPVYDNFFGVGTANQGYYPGVSGALDGYHAITALGYNPSGLVIENSWGAGWGNRGYATLAWSFVNGYVFDAVAVSALRTGQPLSTARPAVSGIARQGQTLTASTGGWRPTPASYAYQWQRADSSGRWANISGATTSSYAPGTPDLAQNIRVLVTATNSSGQGAAMSAAVGPVGTGAPANTAAPVLTGSPARGTTLQASPGTWSPAPTSYAYQWQRLAAGSSAWSNLPGATASSYTPAVVDERGLLRVQVTGVNAYGQAVVLSAATAPVKASPPVDGTLPTVGGTVTIGRSLSASTGTWSGIGNAYRYQWQRNTRGVWSPIAGATAATYTLALADAGATLKVTVTASNPDGTVSADSATTLKVPGGASAR